MDVEDLETAEKLKHKTKSRFTSLLKGVSKKAAGIGADVTVDGVKKKVSRSWSSDVTGYQLTKLA